MRILSPKKANVASINKANVSLPLYSNEEFDKEKKSKVAERLKEILDGLRKASEHAIIKYPDDYVEHLLSYFIPNTSRELILADIKNMLLKCDDLDSNEKQNEALYQLAKSLLDEDDKQLRYISKNLMKVLNGAFRVTKKYFNTDSTNYPYYLNPSYSYSYKFSTSDEKHQFFNNIYSAMNDQGIESLAELSRISGIPKPTLTKLQPNARGETFKITKPTMDKLTQTLGCSTDWLLSSGDPHLSKHMIRKYGPGDSLPTMYKVLAGQCPVPQTLIRPISYGADPDLAFLKYLKDAIPPTQFEKIKKMIREIEMYKGKNREKILDLILKLLEEYRYRHFPKKPKIKHGKIKYKKLESTKITSPKKHKPTLYSKI